MSKITLSSNASGTGTLTIASPNTSTNRTLTLPDSTGTMATAESTLTQFNASGSAPVYACRAWVNFNGTGTVAIRASGNVSSITDNGTGDYTVNFTTAMADANYSVVFGTVSATSVYATRQIVVLGTDTALTLMSTSQVRILRGDTTSATPQDGVLNTVSIFR